MCVVEDDGEIHVAAQDMEISNQFAIDTEVKRRIESCKTILLDFNLKPVRSFLRFCINNLKEYFGKNMRNRKRIEQNNSGRSDKFVPDSRARSSYSQARLLLPKFGRAHCDRNASYERRCRF